MCKVFQIKPASIVSIILLVFLQVAGAAEDTRAIGVEQLPQTEFSPGVENALPDSAGLFVGVNDFTMDAGLASLNCAVNDAISQAYVFVIELKLIPARNCILCLSGKPNNDSVVKQLAALKKAGAEVKSASKSDILNGLTIATRMPVASENIVIISVSSHGFEDKDGIYVMPADGLRSYLGETAIRSRVLSDTISDSRAGKKIVILDACRERVEKSKSSGSGEIMSKNFMQAFSASKGQITLHSCGIGQYSYEDEQSGHGVFTSFLLKGLLGEAPADDTGLITVGQLSKYVSDGVRRWIVRNKPDVAWDKISQPRLDASESGRLMPLAISAEISGEKLSQVREKWQKYVVAENAGSSNDITVAGQNSAMINLKALWEMYLDAQIELDQYNYAKAMAEVAKKYPDHLTENDKQIISAYASVANRSQSPGRLVRLLDAIEAKELREKRPQQVAKIAKISELLQVAKSNDSEENGKKALEALDDLLELESSHTEAIALQKKISGYYGPSPGDIMTNSIGMKLVWIPAGEFMMGSNDGGSGEKPVHKVKLTKGFWMGQCEVTQEQYKEIMGKNPSRFSGSSNPVEKVSWHDAMEFCKKLSSKEGKTYTLPTESQWEYACRAGTSTNYSFGSSESSLGNYGWYTSNSSRKTHPVGQKKPNAWGIYDMRGNVSEWCLDWYDKGYYSSSPSVDPSGPTSGSGRVLRGGCWSSDPEYCRSAARFGFIPDYSGINFGFRVILLNF